jgi:hypothetical protein
MIFRDVLADPSLVAPYARVMRLIDRQFYNPRTRVFQGTAPRLDVLRYAPLVNEWDVPAGGRAYPGAWSLEIDAAPKVWGINVDVAVFVHPDAADPDSGPCDVYLKRVNENYKVDISGYKYTRFFGSDGVRVDGWMYNHPDDSSTFEERGIEYGG